jgi:hypothetical protein
MSRAEKQSIRNKNGGVEASVTITRCRCCNWQSWRKSPLRVGAVG